MTIFCGTNQVSPLRGECHKANLSPLSLGGVVYFETLTVNLPSFPTANTSLTFVPNAYGSGDQTEPTAPVGSAKKSFHAFLISPVSLFVKCATCTLNTGASRYGTFCSVGFTSSMFAHGTA